MRCLLLLCLATMLSAAVETFTLEDGRVITGEYDDADQRLYTSIDGKTQSLLVANDQIVERVPAGTKKPPAPLPAKGATVAPPVIGAEPVVEAPKAMTEAEKRAAELDFARATQIRKADDLESESRKAARDADGARKDSVQKVREAKAHWDAFRERAAAEGVSVGLEPVEELIVLPRTSGNNRKSQEALKLSKQKLIRAAEFDQLASTKRAEAAAERRVADVMARGEKPAIQRASVLPASTAPIADVDDPRPAMRAIRQRADREEQELLMQWIKTIDLTGPPIPELGPDPRQSEVAARERAIEASRPLQKLRLLRELVAGDPDGTNAARSLRGELTQGTPSLLEWYQQHRADR